MRTHERMRWSTFRVIALATYSAGIAYDPHRGRRTEAGPVRFDPHRVAATARIGGKSEAVARVLGLNTANVDVTSVTSVITITSWSDTDFPSSPYEVVPVGA